MDASVATYVEKRLGEFSMIDKDRKAQLKALGAHVRALHDAGKHVRLNFICTHNSRRSHLAQIWAAVAATRFGVPVTCYSGGTESTAFHPCAVDAVRRAGLRVEKTTDDANPIYHVRFGEGSPVLTCFSKKFDGAPNPKKDFAAIMVCSDADEACPVVGGADRRFAIQYEDPKKSDGTPRESATYDERCAQIAREMLYAFSLPGAT